MIDKIKNQEKKKTRMTSGDNHIESQQPLLIDLKEKIK